MIESLDLIAGWLQEYLLLPLLYTAGLMAWEELSFGWALFAVYGAIQVTLTFAICVPLEHWRPVERWADRQAVWVDVLYTVISRVGLLPLITFVLFWQAQTALSGFLTDQGWVSLTLEGLFPALLGQQLLTFILYAIILDAAEYWRHRLSHRYRWWWALHALHHGQRQMTFWSDDRNHLLDDIIAFIWFGLVALLIGVSPMQFPLLILVLRFLESLSHANVRLSFGVVGERLLISPRFHRLHHGLHAAGRRSCNYGAVLPWWDMLFRTADFSPRYLPTGDSSGDERLAIGGYWEQQWAGLRRFVAVVGSRAMPW
ncbi:MAG: sterol desaturase family protein [Acetobacteraceae bacterium]|nr:sterol desaturase family protein [Acetobacteraceae bacterium]